MMMKKEMLGEIGVCIAFPVSLFLSLLFCAVVWG